jgi:hypothetical protein
MRLPTWFAHPRRWDHLRRIQGMDPVADADEIVGITFRQEFPWDYLQGVGIAFLRDYGVPSISRLLDATGEFEHDGVKRYDDTLLIGDEAGIEGLDSPRGRETLRRLNRIHGHYDIPNDEFQYVLATTIVGPVRWVDELGWRRLDPVELQALATYTTRFGELMGIKGLPTTYDGYLQLLVDYERERFAWDPANARLTEASLRILASTTRGAPLWAVRRAVAALVDEPLRQVLGLPRQPAWLGRLLRRALRARAFWLRFAPPRDEPLYHQPTTYPHGYTLADLGPRTMLAHLNADRASH